MESEKSNTRIVCLAVLTAMATILLSYGAQAGDTCTSIYECKNDGGCEHFCELLVGDGSRNYCKSKTECCCPPSTVTEMCKPTLYPRNLSDCQSRCRDPRAYLKQVGEYTDCCCPLNKVAMLPN